MFENPRRGSQAINFTTNVSKILDLKSSSEQIFFRKLSLDAPVWLFFFFFFIRGTLLKVRKIDYRFVRKNSHSSVFSLMI